MTDELFPDGEILYGPPITTDDLVECASRELKLRKSAYPRWVAAGKMKADKAQREIAMMQVILERLQAQQRAELHGARPAASHDADGRGDHSP